MESARFPNWPKSLVAAAGFYAFVRAANWADDKNLLPRWWSIALLGLLLVLLAVVWWRSRLPRGKGSELALSRPWGLEEWTMAYAMPTCILGSGFALFHISIEYGLPDWWLAAWAAAWTAFISVEWWRERRRTAGEANSGR